MKLTTGNKVQVRNPSLDWHGRTGVVLSGPSEQRLVRVLLDPPTDTDTNKRTEIVYLLRNEFVLI